MKQNRVGLLDIDGHSGFPNLALMKIARFFKDSGDNVEWAMPLFGDYDLLYASKVFTFSPEPNWNEYRYRILEKGGTGYDMSKKLPPPIEKISKPDYSIYPNCDYSIQFYSRGCIRKCPFCLVSAKEGNITPVEPMELNPKGKWIEVLDNNFFANPEWESSVKHLYKQKQPVKFHGVDVRIMTEDMAYWLNKLKLKNGVHIAWDLPQIDLRPQLKEMLKWIKPEKIVCYVLVGFNSTREQDYERLRYLKELKILPFVQPYRDFKNSRVPTEYEHDIARWANRMWLFNTQDFFDYVPRQGVRGSDYFSGDFVRKWSTPKSETKIKELDLFSNNGLNK